MGASGPPCTAITSPTISRTASAASIASAKIAAAARAGACDAGRMPAEASPVPSCGIAPQAASRPARDTHPRTAGPSHAPARRPVAPKA